MLRDGRYVNEMTRYRFDVTLHIGTDEDVPVCPNEEYWDEQKLDIASLRQELTTTVWTVQRFNNISNGRLRDVYSRLTAVSGGVSDSSLSWVDYKALPDPMGSIEVTETPVTDLGNDVLAIWSDILGHDRIGIDDNFFEIGGDSLRVIRVQMELRKLLGHAVSAAVLFEYYIIRTLASYLADIDRPKPVIPC